LIITDSSIPILSSQYLFGGALAGEVGPVDDGGVVGDGGFASKEEPAANRFSQGITERPRAAKPLMVK
jgi:hypothetical protein